MNFDKFESLLNEQMSWPDYYQFRFVIKSEHKETLVTALSGHEVTEKLSKKGNYVSVSSRKLVNNSIEVVEVYRSVSTIEGILSL